MATFQEVTGRRALAITQKALKADVKALLLANADAIGATIINLSRFDGTIPRHAKPRIIAIAQKRVQEMFIAPDGSGPYAEDEETALAPYPRILNKHYANGVNDIIQVHNNWMQKNVPLDIMLYLQQKIGRPAVPVAQADNPYLRRPGESVEAHIVRLDELRIFRPNPFVHLDPKRTWVPMHKWNTPNGFQLSDRIWEVSNRTRRDINLMLTDGFRQGTGAQALAKKLVRFMNPDAALLKTNKPYGTNVAFGAMRLARTEISRAVNHAAYTSAYVNPYVDKIDIARSAQGDPKCPICQPVATIGTSGERLREPYHVNAAAIPAFHPHCMCRVLPVVVEDKARVNQQIRAIMADEAQTEYQPVWTAATPNRFVTNLIGRQMFQFVLSGLAG